MRKRIGTGVLLLGLLGAGVFYLFSLQVDRGHRPLLKSASGLSEMPTPELLLGTGSQPGAALATLVRFERTVKSKRADALAWEQAHEEMPLFGNDSVRTFDRSSANVLFGRRDVIEVEENSLIIITARQTRNEDEISMALLSPALLKEVAQQPVEEQERMLQDAIISREVRVVRISAEGTDGEGLRLGVKTLSDESNVLVSRAGTVKLIGPDGSEVVLHENMATTLGPRGVLAAPRTLLRAPALASPPDGSVYTFQRKTPRVKLQWKPVKDAGAYRIVVARDSEFNNIFVDEVLHKTSLVARNVEPGSYFWRVKARDADGIEGASSATRTIRTARDDTPPQLMIAFPPDMFVSPGPQVEIRGQADRQARVRINGHTVQLAPDGGFLHTLNLVEGAMLITVEAIDSAGNVQYRKRLITYRGKRSRVALRSETP